MQLLVLGGTAWLGRHIVRAALDGGHDVTCLARGAVVPDGARLVRANRDRDDALAAVRDDRWDVVIDLTSQPGHARRAARDLAANAGHAVLVSTVSVYADDTQPGADETAGTHAPLTADVLADMADYGAAKVAAEQAYRDGFGVGRSLIVRPGLIGGPGDPTGRTDYWPWRFANPAIPGVVLVPDAPDLPTAIIDVRDLAVFVLRGAEQRVSGTVNALGAPMPFPAHLDVARAAAGSEATPLAVAEERLLAAGVAQWSGPRSLPLWIADPDAYGMNTRSTARARASGLVTRPLVDTLRDGLAWRTEHPGGRAGLTDAEETALVDALSA